MARPRDDLAGLAAELGALGCPHPAAPRLGEASAFDWVADCLGWLCQRAAPGMALPPADYSSEAARVAYMAQLGAAFQGATGIRLNLRRIYRAGGSAARELHRLAAALRSAEAAVAANPPPPPPPPPPSAAAVRRALEAGLAAARAASAQLDAAVAAAGQEVAVLEGRVEKRHVELDRLERRLDSLQAIRPAHSGEVEALEGELAALYSQYLHKFRNLEWLEGLLERHAAAAQAEAEEADRQLRRIQRQVAAEELRLLQGSAEQGGALAALDSDDSEDGEVLLPRLGGLGAGAALGGAAAAAAAALDLLPDEDSSGSASAGAGGTGRSRLSVGSAGGGAEAGGSESRVTFGGASLIPAHRGAPSPAVPRPSSARRTTGSGNAMLRKAGGGGGSAGDLAGADVLVVEGGMRRASLLDAGGNDF